MTAGTQAATITLVGGMAEIDRAAWDSCANPSPAEGRADYNPFVSWDFLEALERSVTIYVDLIGRLLAPGPPLGPQLGQVFTQFTNHASTINN